MKRDALDLSPLDPSLDPARWEGLVGGVMERAAPELARRAAAAGGMVLLAHWARPIAAAAAVVALAAAGTLALSSQEAEAAPAGIPEALGLPTPVSDWLAEDRPPVATDLMIALERGMP